eukprot:CAMPEP_0181244498 /NCGR_PEP_ID=MMETSP1096-20121128/42897_1 /TAXON_ID=156174 ORGANISM="Chrysochromulina ericina, Strain CCMP281" /NCGR_SAMPLE_ID=MMETSP1096 /ASSEMBLY_ACC=CAM_ASM_000453 /LENGTH=74 /DNA_ID=CAMNT_0023341061 /DNA_START=190 /DNA_END=414 /DNA_ORIENTATION=+
MALQLLIEERRAYANNSTTSSHTRLDTTRRVFEHNTIYWREPKPEACWNERARSEDEVRHRMPLVGTHRSIAVR